MRAVAVFFLVSVGAVVMAAEPINVRGVELGDTQAQLFGAVPDAQCNDASPGVTECSFSGYGPDPRAAVLVELVDDRVYLVYSIFDRDHFPTVLQGLSQKFGAPAVTQEHSVTNAAGAEFPSRKLMWSAGKGATLVLTERDGHINRSTVRLAELDGMRAANARRAADPKAADNL
jgi:hypothetical protein